jgi:hypothetical protein
VRFVASHVSFSKIEDGWVFALADSEDGSTHVLVSFAEQEDEQDRALNLTGLFVAPSWTAKRGYGFVDRVEFDGERVTILGCNGHEDVVVEIATQMMPPEEISRVVDLCNQANVTRPKSAA